MTALLLSLLASGTRVVYQELPCPIGDDVVRVYQLVSSNTLGGYDSDLATYASQGQFREYAVATCASSLFSLPVTRIQDPIDPARHPALLAALAEEVAALSDPDEPAVWERYGIAARMLDELGVGPLEQGELYLQASWTARDTVVGYHQGLTGPAAVQALIAAGRVELEKPLTDEQRRTVLYTLARAAHRGGLSEARDDYLRQFEAVGGLSADEQQALAEFRHIAQTTEPHYQDLAIAAFQAALRDGLPVDSRLRTTYLVADLLRRRGRSAEALPLYQAVLSDNRTPPNIREMAELFVSGLTPR
jgi:hypothetical protein